MAGRNENPQDAGKKQGGGSKQSSRGTATTSGELTQTEKHMAKKAQNEFNKGHYSNCLKALNNLEKTRSKDVKLAHNKAVCE
jgi:hypothetical protein